MSYVLFAAGLAEAFFLDHFGPAAFYIDEV